MAWKKKSITGLKKGAKFVAARIILSNGESETIKIGNGVPTHVIDGEGNTVDNPNFALIDGPNPAYVEKHYEFGRDEDQSITDFKKMVRDETKAFLEHYNNLESVDDSEEW